MPFERGTILQYYVLHNLNGDYFLAVPYGCENDNPFELILNRSVFVAPVDLRELLRCL